MLHGDCNDGIRVLVRLRVINTIRNKAGEHERKTHVFLAAKVLLRSCTPNLHDFAAKLKGFQAHKMQSLYLKVLI